MKKSNIFLFVFFVLLVSYFSISCATIMHGTNQKIGVSSQPVGAKVFIDNKEMGKAPLFANLARKDEHIVRLELEGYEKASFTITSSTSGWVWGNIIFGGLIGLAVDAVTGGLYDLEPEQIYGELAKKGASLELQKNGLYILVVMEPDPSWKKLGNLYKIEN